MPPYIENKKTYKKQQASGKSPCKQLLRGSLGGG